MSDDTFDKQTLVDLINNVKLANSRKQEYFYFCCSEPSDEIKEILKALGVEYKIISNRFVSDLNLDKNTAFIIPKYEL